MGDAVVGLFPAEASSSTEEAPALERVKKVVETAPSSAVETLVSKAKERT